MHEKNILHRDLKLENIMVTFNDDNEIETLKIIDLGLSYKFDDNNMKTKGMIGTLHYMPPEVFWKKEYDYKYDVYSMGVIAFTLLAHEFPFNGNSLPELSNNIMKNMPDFHKLTEKGISIDCVDLIKNMMKKHSNKR